MPARDLERELLAQLAVPFTGEELFDGLTDVAYFLKDAQGRYVVVNQTLASRCGWADKSKLVGKTPSEVFPAPLGERYQAQDAALLKSGKALLNELELHLHPSGDAGWCLTTKLPLRGKNGVCVGLAGLSKDLHPASPTAPHGSHPDDERRERVAEAVRWAQAHLSEPLHVDDLASRAGLSAYQFDQRVRKVFHLTPAQLLLKFRMDHAAGALRDTQSPILQIALDCGYSDQSAFTRQFRKTVGLSPGEYRRSRRSSDSGS